MPPNMQSFPSSPIPQLYYKRALNLTSLSAWTVLLLRAGFTTNTDSQANSLFIQKNGDDNADDEDHGQDRAQHPYEPISSVYWQRVHGQLANHHRVSVRAGCKHFLSREKFDKNELKTQKLKSQPKLTAQTGRNCDTKVQRLKQMCQIWMEPAFSELQISAEKWNNSIQSDKNPTELSWSELKQLLTPLVALSSASRKKTYSSPGSRGLFSQLLWRVSDPTVKLAGSCLKQAMM